jgi:hypothetical protein
MKITTIINFCTNDYVFLKHCIDHAKPFSTEIIVPYCDHFHDGTPENRVLLDKAVAENPGVQFVEFAYDKNQSSRWHCNVSRKIGIELSSDQTEYILLLDTDEIIESDKFIEWVKQEEKVGLVDSYKIANYFYFRETKFRSNNIEESIILVKKGPITSNDDFVFHNEERGGLFYFAPTKKWRCMLDGKPFIHHYSWVRSKEAMIKKVTAWSHNKDKDWISLVHKEFEAPFRGTDLIFPDRKNKYETVEPYINLIAE